MGRVFGLIGVLIALAAGSYVYMQQTRSVAMGTNNPRAAADITGVKMDLLSMAQAERAYFARENHYASLEDLHASGDLSVLKDHRDHYTYSATYGDNSFRITATYSGPPAAQMPPSFSITENMEVGN
jgi:hypothetical protein